MTYRYFDGRPLYPFGHGLSYSEFVYENLKTELTESGIYVTCSITNSSDTDGDEVAQVYVHAESERIQRPLKQLCAFDRIHIKAGETAAFDAVIPFAELEIYDVSREKFCLESGDFTVMIGASSADIRLSDKIYLSGEAVPPRNLTAEVRAELYDTQDGTEIFTNPLSGVTHVRGLQWHNEIVFQNCDLTNAKSLKVWASAPVDPLKISVYLDDEKTPVTEISIPVSDGFEDFQICKEKLTADGCHDLRLTFGQGACIRSIQIEK